MPVAVTSSVTVEPLAAPVRPVEVTVRCTTVVRVGDVEAAYAVGSAGTYVAVNARCPAATAVRVEVATPATSGAVSTTTPSWRNCTSPPGVAAEVATDARRVTVRRTASAVRPVVVLAAGVTTATCTATGCEVDGPYWSPEPVHSKVAV